MTVPKHIPLPKRWSDDFHQFVQDRADALEALVIRVVEDLVPHPIKAALKAYDDAHEIGDEDWAAMSIDPTGGPGVTIRPFTPEETAALDAADDAHVVALDEEED